MTKEVIFRGVSPRDHLTRDMLRIELTDFLDSSDPDDAIVITFTRMYKE